jgi:hypothetical protein
MTIWIDPTLSVADRIQIEQILSHRANEIAVVLDEYRKDGHRIESVEHALTREITRLRGLAMRVLPRNPEDEG